MGRGLKTEMITINELQVENLKRVKAVRLEPDEEKPPTAATEDGQTGKSLENEYPSLF